MQQSAARKDITLHCCACSLCPTFAAVALFINNARWDGVPFLLKAGKALASRRTEIRVQFHHVPGNLYRDRLGMDLDRATNELARSIAHLNHGCTAALEHMQMSFGLNSLLIQQGGPSLMQAGMHVCR